MFELTDLKVCKYNVNINTTKNKIELYNFPEEKIDGVSYDKVRDEIERDLDISVITATDLQDEIIAPIFIKNIQNKFQKDSKMPDI